MSVMSGILSSMSPIAPVPKNKSQKERFRLEKMVSLLFVSSFKLALFSVYVYVYRYLSEIKSHLTRVGEL